MRVLGIIPARGGSKGIPRKNLIPLAGKPLLYYTVQAALESRRLTRTILSSDDAEICSAGRSYGVDVPFVRPAELATDEASSVKVALHALQFAEKEEGRKYDLVCLLQPTCPLRNSDDVDTAVGLLESSDADAVISLALVDEPHPFKMMVIREGAIHPLFREQWRET